jgi:hypothetical protein
MSLIKEDGTLVTDADTYASVADLDAYATNYGVTLPTTTAEKETLLRKAMDYLARYTEKWKGTRVDDTQSLDWPRSGVYVDGVLRAEDEIPRELFYAQLSLSVAAIGTTLLPVQAAGEKGPTIEETVDVITLKYANPNRVLAVAADATADALLRVLLRRSGLEVIRA